MKGLRSFHDHSSFTMSLLVPRPILRVMTLLSVGLSARRSSALMPSGLASLFRRLPARPRLVTSSAHEPQGSSSSSSSTTSDCPLPYSTGPYQAAEVHDFPSDTDAFWQALGSSLAYWRSHEYNSAWMYIPAERASLVEGLTASPWEFDLHHANATTRTIVLKKWLRAHHDDKIPPFCTHQVGCAGFVLNDSNEMLLIQEWRGPASQRQPTQQWKLPGGLLDAGESFEEATCREVFEETGIACEFESILTFWHRHGLHLGKSDLYFVSLLKPKNLDIVKCPEEISNARWMSIDDFFATQQTHPLIRHVLRHNFHLDDNSAPVGNVTRIEPLAEMAPGAVQWPNRDPYPTYSSVVRRRRD